MIEIKEVKTKSDIKKFVTFPHKLYNKNANYVPFLDIDEVNKFNEKKNESYDDCIVKCYLAYKNKKIVGRIAGIVQKLYNAKVNEKRVRFSRFDCINDTEVSTALFKTVEAWAKEQGMDVIHGPMGYNDLDREGLLIEGFDHLSTFEEQYNYPYYAELIENYGFKKEVDWVEYRIKVPKEPNERVERLSEIVAKRYKLNVMRLKSIKDFVAEYKDQFFETLDAAYSHLYGVVPFSDKLKDSLIDQFGLILNKDFIVGITNEEGVLVAFGLIFPSLSEAVNKSKGKLLPWGIFRMLKQIKKPRNVDLGLIAIRPEYQNKGVNTMIISTLMKVLIKKQIQFAETNLMLEDNSRIQSQWDLFEHVQHKRRRSYVKEMN